MRKPRRNSIPFRFLMLAVPALFGCFDHPNDKVTAMVCQTDANCPSGYRCARPGVAGGCSKQNPNADGGPSLEAGRGEPGRDVAFSPGSDGKLEAGKAVLDAASDTPVAPLDVNGNRIDTSTDATSEGTTPDVPQVLPVDGGSGGKTGSDGAVASGGMTGSGGGTGGVTAAGGSTGGGGAVGSGGIASSGGAPETGGNSGPGYCVVGVSPIEQCKLAP